MRGVRWSVAAIVLVFAGCATVDYRLLSAPEIFAQGQKYYDAEKWERAKEAFERLKEVHPFSVKVTPAELRIAEILYHKRQFAESAVALDEFVTRHPTNEEVPRAIYYLGMANYEQKLSLDRDPTLTKEAERHFQRLVSQFPSSPFAAQGKERLAEVRLRLAKRERYVGRFYWRQGEYFAALGRYRGLATDYADTPLAEEALYFAARCHVKLHDPGAAGTTLAELLEKYPQGVYAAQARSLAASLAKPDAK
jgi:outer membrane protein assembly factor BamD